MIVNIIVQGLGTYAVKMSGSAKWYAVWMIPNGYAIDFILYKLVTDFSWTFLFYILGSLSLPLSVYYVVSYFSIMAFVK